MKRKCLAVFMMAVFIVSCFAVPSFAQSDDLVFSMDLSEYSNTTPVIKNAADAGSSDGITFKGVNNSSGHPQLATFESTSGSTTYLTFTDPEDVTSDGRYGSFQIGKDKLDDWGVTNSTALTVEWWSNTYADSTGYSMGAKLFKYGTTSLDKGFMEIYVGSGNTFSMRASGKENLATGWWEAASVNIASNLDSWHHYVWTRSWDETKNYYRTTLYRDGEVVSSLSNACGGYKNDEDVSGAAFCVGGNYNGYNIYGGGIGMFNIYTAELSAAEASQRYLLTKDLFSEPVKQVLAEEDMTKYEVGESPVGTKMFTQSRATEGDMSDLTVREAVSTNGIDTIKYIEISNGGASAKDTYYGYKFSPVFSESFVAYINLQPVGLSPSSRALRWGKNTIIHDMRVALSAEIDEYGFHNLRYIFVMGEDGKYDMTCIDRLTGETIATKEDIASNCEYILCQQYHAPGQEKYLNVSKFKVFRYTVPEISAHNADSLGLDDEYITIEFTEPLDEASVTNDAFVLENMDTNRVITTELESYNAETSVVTIKLREYLDASNSYRLSVADVCDMDGFAIGGDTSIDFTMPDEDSKVASVVYKDSSDSVITALGSNKNISVSVTMENNTAMEKNYKVILLLLNDEGVVVDAAAGTGSDEAPITAALTGNVTASEGYSAKCLVWENTQNGYKALMQTPSVIK